MDREFLFECRRRGFQSRLSCIFLKMGDNFDCMEIGEEGKASGEFHEDWMNSGTVDFDDNNSRRKKG